MFEFKNLQLSNLDEGVIVKETTAACLKNFLYTFILFLEAFRYLNYLKCALPLNELKVGWT